jgi:hypothetical protein
MKLLSIDVGIKNLAYCLFDLNPTTNTHDIILWDVINLCGKPKLCSTPNCKKNAKFTLSTPSSAQTETNFNFCAVHAKKTKYLMPTPDISLKKIGKMKLVDLNNVIQSYSIPLNSSINYKKEDLLKRIQEFMKINMLQTISASSANDLDLIKIGVAMRNAFDNELKNHLTTIEHIVIENQISPIANRMKTLQGMLAQYFIMHDKTQISFVSAANKLKGHEITNSSDETNTTTMTDTSSYASRKKEGIRITLQLLNDKHPTWLSHFKTHKKKDDLADAFLQGNWFLNK